ncbi:armadillo repeat-containing protein 3 [Sphaeramia orbicularis]|uniref:armadillo repeat-containing protein 3 n=1 Tax=Sphaeramia orbicularis TaxID=375764 RepID=UPI00117F590C|nr:armadillo repeat-containing protein 3 [Sphaeramia orbicularis]
MRGTNMKSRNQRVVNSVRSGSAEVHVCCCQLTAQPRGGFRMVKKGKKESETPSKETFEPLSFEGKTPATVVLLLSSPEEDILIKACETVHAFAERGDENKVSLLGLGALEPLCQLITHNNRLVKRNAFMALGIMSTHGDVKSAMKQVNVIPSIIGKLSLDEDTVVQEFGTLCLASLSVDFVCKTQIFDNNGLPPVIQLLSSPDPDVKKNSLEIIFNLVQDNPSRLAIHELGVIPPLLELLKSDFPVIQHLALKTLQNVTTVKDTRNTFREEQGFDRLMGIVNNKDLHDLHAEALQVVANCLNDSECLEFIYKGGGLTQLMEFLLTPSKPEIQANTVKCIARVAQSPENRKLLHEQNVENILVELLSVADDGVKTVTCEAVATMSSHLPSKDIFRDLKSIPSVVRLLRSESLMVREAATKALSDLTHNNWLNAFAVYEAGGHEHLLQQLSECCPSTVASAAATLANMAEQDEIRCSILSHGAMHALVEPLKSTNTQVVVNTTLCLAALACDTASRAEFQKAGGLRTLVDLLHSNHKDVLHNACLAVNICASDEPTTVEMCKFGALEMLKEINQSVNRRNRFSELAMTSLLKSNLPVKYSLTGCLSSTDLIMDGFYDAGKAIPGQRVLSLEELSGQSVDERRAIIVINTATEDTTDVSEERCSLSEADISIKGNHKTSRKKEEDKQKDEDQPHSPTEKRWKMMNDVSLQVLVKEAKESILPLNDEREQYVALARLVSKAMGGGVELEKLHEFQWNLHLSELKFQLQSNVVPIGMISRGIFCHRALLFKCLADCIGLSCTLVRGEYNRAWNEVLLFSPAGSSAQPSCYIVDLMHSPGSMLRVNTPAAVQYQTI